MLKTSNYLIQLSLSIAAYAAGLIAMNFFYRSHPPLKYWLVLLPILPLIYAVKVILTAIAQVDEMWRKIIMEGFAFSGIATGFTCFSYLFIRDMGGVEFQSEWTFYLMWIYYGIGSFFSWRRHQ